MTPTRKEIATRQLKAAQFAHEVAKNDLIAAMNTYRNNPCAETAAQLNEFNNAYTATLNAADTAFKAYLATL